MVENLLKSAYLPPFHSFHASKFSNVIAWSLVDQNHYTIELHGKSQTSNKRRDL